LLRRTSYYQLVCSSQWPSIPQLFNFSVFT